MDKYRNDSEKLHVSIESGDLENVRRFLEKYPKIKFAFSSDQESAALKALKEQKIEIYEILISNGLSLAPDEDIEKIVKDFPAEIKRELREIHKPYVKDPRLKHLTKLIAKSWLAHDAPDFNRPNRGRKYLELIAEAFEELNEIEWIEPMLKVVANGEKLKIIFDFNRDSIEHMDPTNDKRVKGICYFKGGDVYIGAKFLDDDQLRFKAMSVIAHELSHYAMNLIYQNTCKPYKDSDEKTHKEFEDIMRSCGGKQGVEPYIDVVYKYPEDQRHSELIVRVPHLLALYKGINEKLDQMKEAFTELFQFYESKVLVDFQREHPLMEARLLIEGFNELSGLAEHLQYSKISLLDALTFDLKATRISIISSNCPQVTMQGIYQQFQNEVSPYIFVKLETLKGDKMFELATTALSVCTEPTMIIDCDKKSDDEIILLKDKFLDPEICRRIIFVIGSEMVKCDESESYKVNHCWFKLELEHQIELKALTHKWSELTETCKPNLLSQNVIFNGIEMKLSELVEPSSEAMNFFPLGELVDCKEFKIGHELHQTSHNFYIPRKFVRKEQTNSTSSKPNNFEELLKDEPKMCAMIISDEAGSGKSVTLFEIAGSLHELYPDRWVLFVDLKHHIEAFKRIQDYEKVETFQDFILDHILKDDPKFDRELFKEMFRDGKTFVLFDGFDEISPNYKDLLLHFLRLFEPEPGNQLFITTRPHLEAYLINALGDYTFKLEELSKEDQKSFLREYFKSNAFKSEEDLEVLSERLLRKFSEISTSKFIGLPLLMRMTAEISSDAIQENLLDKMDTLNVASIFKEFVDKYFLRWKESGNEISLKENVEIDRDGGILEIHHSIAIKHKFGEKFEVLEVDEGDAEKIARVGLVRYDKTEKTFQFIHETFAEYFVADFICFHLRRKNRNRSHDCRTAIEILVEVLDGSSYQVIETFLNQTLEATKLKLKEASCQSAAKFLSEIVKSQNCFGILWKNLYGGAENDNENIILLLSIVNYADKNVLLRMFESRDDGGYGTALLNAATYRNSEIISSLCNIIATSVDNPKVIFHQENCFSDNVLFMAACNDHKGALTALCESLKTVFTKDEIKIMFQRTNSNGENIISYAAESSHEAFKELLSLLPDYLSVDELKEFLMDVDDHELICLQYALAQSTKNHVERQIDFIKSLFDAEEQKIFFQQRSGRYQRNIFHLAALNSNEKIFQTLVDSTRDLLSNDDLKFMLMATDLQRSNVLHLATSIDEYILNDLDSVLRKYLTDEDIKSLLLQVNEKGENCFRLAADNTKIDYEVFHETIGNLLPQEDQDRLIQESSREIDIFRVIAGESGTEDIPTDTIKYLLTRRNNYEHNVFQAAAASHFSAQRWWNQLVAFVKATFSDDEMKIFLIDYDEDDASCFHLAVENNWCEGICEAVCGTYKSALSIEGQRKIVQQKYSDQTNVLHRAAKKGFEKLNFVFGYLSELLSRDEIKVMLNQKGSDGGNILFHSLHDTEVLQRAASFLTEFLSNDEIKNLLLDEDYDGLTCFEYSVGFKSGRAIESLVNFIKKVLNLEDQKKIFGTINLFRLAAGNKNVEVLSTLRECLKDVFTENEIKSMKQEKT